MIRLNIAEAKARFSEHLERVERGETIVICRRNVPIAELRPLTTRRTEARPVGIDRGLSLPAGFFEPLPEDVLDAFHGEDR